MKRVTLIAAAAAAATALLAGAPAASAARTYAGQPRGSSGFQMVLSLDSAGKRVTGLTFHLDVSCAQDFRSVDFGRAQVVNDLPDEMLAGDHYLVAKLAGKKLTGSLVGFDVVGQSTAQSMNVTLSGTVGASVASGRARIQFVDSDTVSGNVTAQCSQTIAWKALRNPGVVYGGTTSQNEPIVVELTPSRRQVSHSHVSWIAPCRTGGAWTEPHDEFDLKPFSISAGNAFSRSYRFSFGSDTVENERFTGRIGKTKASGTFRADITITGTTPDTCSSGAVSWAAATG